MLTLLTSFAQEESLSISENCKWGIRKRFQSSKIGTANKHLLGYQYDEEQKKYVIIPEEAKAVRWMKLSFIKKCECTALRTAENSLQDTIKDPIIYPRAV